MNNVKSDIIKRLLASAEPAIVYKALAGVKNLGPGSKVLKDLQNQVKNSPRVKTLLSIRNESGEIPFHPYRKWSGAHWVLAILSDLGYPPGDKSLTPLRDQVYDWLFSEKHEKSIKNIRGKVRRCASQEGYAVYYLLKLGLNDDRTDELARRLIEWQWPDGGWNCDKNPSAGISSFIESLIPMRALLHHARQRRNALSKKAALKTSEIFLKRRLFKSLHNGNVIKEKFIRLHYPCYYEYDILFALKVLTEGGLINDSRCNDALDLLESKRLSDGGFPAETTLYRKVTDPSISRGSLVDWGGQGKKRFNEWVTVDALSVLKAAGRLA